MFGYCTNCDTYTSVEKIEGGSAGQAYLCGPCRVDMDVEELEEMRR